MHLELPEPSPSGPSLESVPAPRGAAQPDIELRVAEHREQTLLADAARFVAEQSERRYRALVEASSDVMWMADANGLVIDMPRWHELTGLPQDDALGDGWLAAVHDDDQHRVRDRIAASRLLGRPVRCDLRLRMANGSYRWLTYACAPVMGDREQILEWVGTWTDVHDRKRAEETQELLNAVGASLLASDDLEAILDGVMRLVVPRVADMCHFDLVDPSSGRLERAAVAHVNAEKLAIFREATDKYPPSSHAMYASATAVRTGQARLLNDLDDLYYLSLAEDEDHLRALRALAPRAYVAAPLVARGNTLGAVVLTHADSKRRFSEYDVTLAEELASRTALAIDNLHRR